MWNSYGLYVFAGLLCWPAMAAAFSDVGPTHPYIGAIEWAQAENLVGGYPDGTFRPDAVINRAELMKIAIGSYFPPMERNICDPHHIYQFPDAGHEEWYSSYLCSAFQHHIIEGYPDGTVRLDQPITYVEAAKVIGLAWNHQRLTLNENNVPFPEDTGGPWYEVYVQHLENNEAVPPSISSFGQLLTRGEMVYIMNQLGSRVHSGDYWKTYTDAGKNFSIDFPADWQLNDDFDNPQPITEILPGKHTYYIRDIGFYTQDDLLPGETWPEFAYRSFPELEGFQDIVTDYGDYTQHYFINYDGPQWSYILLEEGGTALVLFFGSNSTDASSLRGTIKYLK
jgi:hypothetical protein